MDQLYISIWYCQEWYTLSVKYSDIDKYHMSALLYIINLSLRNAKIKIYSNKKDVTKEISFYTLLEPYYVSDEQTANKLCEIFKKHSIHIFERNGLAFRIRRQ